MPIVEFLTVRQFRLVAELVHDNAKRHANRPKSDWSYDMAPDEDKRQWAELADEWQEIDRLMQKETYDRETH